MELSEILRRHQFRFKKALGQNFIADKNLLDAIAHDAGVEGGDTVLEIGAGAGTLTRALSKAAKRVVAFEIDRSLEPVLSETLAEYKNVEVVFEDVLKLSDGKLNGLAGGEFKVCANLPYYITSEVLMRFIESRLEVKSITVMVQKEVAERLTAKAGTPEYGALTLAAALYGDAQIMRIVPRKVFYPEPGVDSAVVRITKSQTGIENAAQVKKLIRAAFSMRRKTLLNNLAAAGYQKDKAAAAIKAAGLAESVRGEALKLSDFIKLESALRKD
ncbi:MAG TPA: 16S rRNA (adenine(1518)-N(6)/adenine(1519)-N(6))-dimethyltransferase RsmA [Eubacteriales bacterium]|jgi:16S rRNA (adenine1518-N6/adenine1519-N6)-dimethyltransferase|nr:16S rRNA (adenine(1518)-N(6)/adenine(1519)-N(6))-dimethyltransferase RsmA [Clostridia bacterium]HRR89308.1 16S rRNA (adenine(1518)-N(6)/adenine(1519)-N(6))-dimethyltransferase RsmA [Eubacteriales bacterium]HRU83826.1 16S rRNA (adenine(1518)-N(6)/adenine(1519)-N(6))-dimethyltransferase RsmA [Eubacteriales bacterium]